MVEEYGTTGIPGGSASIDSGGTLSIGSAFETTLGLVGNMDTSEGSATPGDVYTVESSTEAQNLFGEDSELATQIELSLVNDARTIYALPVEETTGETETFTGTASGTLDSVPAFDPTLHPDHEITAQDTTEAVSASVETTYASPPSAPSEVNTINLNPVTGEWEADESSDYEITYDHGDFSTAITDVTAEVPRIVGVLSENSQHGTDLLSELNSYDVDFDFMHGMIGALPEIDPNDYSDNFDDRRLAVVAPSRAYTDAAQEDMTRTTGVVAGKQSGKSLGDTTTYENVGGLSALHTQYTTSELSTLIDEQVYPLQQSGAVRVVRDNTTSTDARFDRIAWSEITDDATQRSHTIVENYVGEKMTDDNLLTLEESHATSFDEMEADELLEAYQVSTSAVSDTEVDVTVSLDLIGYMDNIDVNITVGDIVQNQGVS